jgi:hypothetical protein
MLSPIGNKKTNQISNPIGRYLNSSNGDKSHKSLGSKAEIGNNSYNLLDICTPCIFHLVFLFQNPILLCSKRNYLILPLPAVLIKERSSPNSSMLSEVLVLTIIAYTLSSTKLDIRAK